jgi:hypothetical protein
LYKRCYRWGQISSAPVLSMACAQHCKWNRYFLLLTWMYEATLTSSGVNNQNIGALEKPHDIWHPSFQRRFNISVWTLIVNDYLTSSYVIVNYLSGIKYTHFIERVFPILLNDVPMNYSRFKIITEVTMKSTIFRKNISLNIHEDMWFLHNHLSETWIGHGGLIVLHNGKGEEVH